LPEFSIFSENIMNIQTVMAMAPILLKMSANPGRRLPVEISSHYPYYTAKLAPEPEEQTTAGQQAQKSPEAQAVEMVGAEDRLELVRTQNLASPPQEPVDLARAAELLRQVQDQMQTMNKQDARELYQFDRLRDLLYRVSQPEGV
jgi:hypothetical protein